MYNDFKRWKNDLEAPNPVKPEAKIKDSKDKKNQKKTQVKPPT